MKLFILLLFVALSCQQETQNRASLRQIRDKVYWDSQAQMYLFVNTDNKLVWVSPDFQWFKRQGGLWFEMEWEPQVGHHLRHLLSTTPSLDNTPLDLPVAHSTPVKTQNEHGESIQVWPNDPNMSNTWMNMQAINTENVQRDEIRDQNTQTVYNGRRISDYRCDCLRGGTILLHPHIFNSPTNTTLLHSKLYKK